MNTKWDTACRRYRDLETGSLVVLPFRKASAEKSAQLSRQRSGYHRRKSERGLARAV